MDIIKEISATFSIDTKQPPATEEEIKTLRNFSPIEIPSDYLEVVRQATEMEIKVGNHKYIRIWGPSGCIEMNEAYNIQDFIPNSLAVGDDEGGSALIYLTGKDGFGLYITGFGDLDVDDAIKLAPTLRDLLVNHSGLEKLLDY